MITHKLLKRQRTGIKDRDTRRHNVNVRRAQSISNPGLDETGITRRTPRIGRLSTQSDRGKISPLDKLHKLKRGLASSKNLLTSLGSSLNSSSEFSLRPRRRTITWQKDDGPQGIDVHFKVAVLGLLSSGKMKILNRCVGKILTEEEEKQTMPNQTIRNKSEHIPSKRGDHAKNLTSMYKDLRGLRSISMKRWTNAEDQSSKRSFKLTKRDTLHRAKTWTGVANDASGASMTSTDGLAVYHRKVQMNHVKAYFSFWTYAEKDKLQIQKLWRLGIDAKKTKDELSGKIVRSMLKDANALVMVYNVKQIESFEYLHFMERITKKLNLYRMLIRNGEEEEYIHIVQSDHELLASNFDAHMSVCGGTGDNVGPCFNKIMADILRRSKLLGMKNEQDMIKLKGKKLEN